MSTSMSLSMQESFDNYSDYKGDIEKELKQMRNYMDTEHLEKAVIKELYVKGLINHTFCVNQTKNIKEIYKYRNNQNNTSLYYYSCIFLIVFGFMCIKYIYIYDHDL